LGQLVPQHDVPHDADNYDDDGYEGYEGHDATDDANDEGVPTATSFGGKGLPWGKVGLGRARVEEASSAAE
jgi:hypothetical protein